MKLIRWTLALAAASLLSAISPARAQTVDLSDPALAAGRPVNLIGRALPLTAADPSGLTMQGAVLLMRHGVRPPTSTPKFQVFASQPLPTVAAWGATDGNLTPNGAKLVGALARVERSLYAAKGILSATGCPAAGEVFIWADNASQRTIDTGTALAANMYSGCGVVSGISATANDPLFTPPFALNTTAALTAVLQHMGGSFTPLQTALAPLFAKTTAVTGCCSLTLCQQNALPAGCGFGDLPWSVTSSAGALTLNGPLGNGSSLTQVFELEYENGLSGANLGFGNLDRAGVLTLEQIYTVKYDYYDRTPILATNKGSNIAQQMLDAVVAAAGGGTVAGGPPASKLTVYVGHDSTLAAMGGMLNLHWALPGYPADDMPAAGTLGFEVLADGAGAQYVRPVFLALTLDAMHAGLPKASFVAPIYQAIQLPGCDLDAGRLCTLGAFKTLMAAAIDPVQTAPFAYK